MSKINAIQKKKVNVKVITGQVLYDVTFLQIIWWVTLDFKVGFCV